MKDIQSLIESIKQDDSLSKKAIESFMKTVVPDLEKGEFFSGFDCECDSWDGLSNRCECGNRRVYWSNMDDDIWYPQAD